MSVHMNSPTNLFKKEIEFEVVTKTEILSTGQLKISVNLVGWGLTICLWLGPPWFNYWFPFTPAYSRISHEYSSLFIIVINLIFVFRFDALTDLETFMRTEFLCVSV